MQMIQSGNGHIGSSLVGATIDEKQIDARLLKATARTGGELEVSLAWNTLTDLDIQVRDPAGELISAKHPRSASGGVQDVDANSTLVTVEGSRRAAMGLNPGPENVTPLPEELVDLDTRMGLPHGIPGLNLLPPEEKALTRFTRAPIEHIYFEHAPKGLYTVYAHCYSWREPNMNPLPCTVEVRSHGRLFYAATGTLGPGGRDKIGFPTRQITRFG